VGHAKDDVLDATGSGAVDQSIEHRNNRFTTFE
jgi:hypothetical protein